MCALKDAYRNQSGVEPQSWWEYVEGFWPVAAGLVAWEVEKYSECCLRKE